MSLGCVYTILTSERSTIIGLRGGAADQLQQLRRRYGTGLAYIRRGSPEFAASAVKSWGARLPAEGPRHAGLFFVPRSLRIRPVSDCASASTRGHLHRFRPARTPDGLVTSTSVRTTPDDPVATAILAGIATACAPATAAADVVHGSTVATNAVLERQGRARRAGRRPPASRTSCASAGRRAPSSTTSSSRCRGRSSIPTLTFGVAERLDADGPRRRRRSTDAEIRTAGRPRCERAARTSSRSACCTRTSNPAHEQRGRRAAARDAAGSCRASSRSAAGVPRVRAVEHDGRQCVRHAAHRSLSRRGSRPELGRRAARDHAVERRLDLGRRGARAGGAHGAVRPGRPASSARARWPRRPGSSASISFDMGGTSTDVSLIDGEIATTTESTHRRLSGAAAGDRHPHRRRRRRIDRVRRQRRRAARRTAQRRRRCPVRSATARAPS